MKIVGVVTNNLIVGKRLSCAPKKQPHAHSGCKKHGQPTNCGKLRLIIVLTEFDLAIWRNGEPDTQDQKQAHREHDKPAAAGEQNAC
jgi:hypothetical protein